MGCRLWLFVLSRKIFSLDTFLDLKDKSSYRYIFRWWKMMPWREQYWYQPFSPSLILNLKQKNNIYSSIHDKEAGGYFTPQSRHWQLDSVIRKPSNHFLVKNDGWIRKQNLRLPIEEWPSRDPQILVSSPFLVIHRNNSLDVNWC